MAAAMTVDGPRPKDVRPPVTGFYQTPWPFEYCTSFSLDDEADIACTLEFLISKRTSVPTPSIITKVSPVQQKNGIAIEALKDEARSMLMAVENTTPEKLVLIDTLERLGLAYHFEQEIEDQLQQIFNFLHEDEVYDLFTTALQFRLLRQHRHHASSSVFDKFKGESNNKFQDTLINDAKGLLSLYEAAHLRIHGEEILDEAVVFTAHHLNRMVQQLESPLQDQVKRALEQPLFRGVPRVEAHYFISFYEKDSSKNDILLKLAKLDYNYVQNIYKKELCEFSRKWMELNLKSKLPYIRDGVAELYFWAVTHCCQPQYSHGRALGIESYQLTGVMDDTYDNYATLEEAQLLTEIFQRWNIDEIDQLPDYMKVVYRYVLSVFDNYEDEAAKLGRSFAAPYFKEAIKQLSRGYIREMRWCLQYETPTFEEYLDNVVIVNCNHVYHTQMFLGFESASKEIFDWLMANPKILVASGMITRHLNNGVSCQRESKGGAILTAVDFYMKQHGTSKQETMAKFAEFAEDGWKDANKEWITNTSIPKILIENILNYARASELVYRNCKDGYTNPEQMKQYIAALFVDPIII